MNEREGKRQRPRLTVVLGAGASVLNGGPTTGRLSDEIGESMTIRSYPRSFDYANLDGRPLRDVLRELPVPSLALGALAAAFKKPDFELFLDALEELQAVSPAYQDVSLPDASRATITAFVDPKPDYRDLFDEIPVQPAHQEAIHLINFIIEESTADPTPREAGIDIRQLLSTLAERYALTVISLNYDVVVDDCGIDWFDGYTRDVNGKFRTFEPEVWMTRDSDAHVLMHLHGSIRWGYHGDFGYRSPYEPVKFPTPTLARETIQRGLSASVSVHGRFFGPTPIISGLNKGGKMIYNARPYGYYYQEAMRTLTKEPRLLVVGYGGRDPHLNELIYEYVNVHDVKRRPVAAVKIPGSDVGERTPLRELLERIAGRTKFNADVAYAEHHEQYPDAPRLQSHGALLMVPAGLPLLEGDVKVLQSFWES